MQRIWKQYQPTDCVYTYLISNYGEVKKESTGNEVGNYKNAGYRCVPYTTTIRKNKGKKPLLGKKGKPIKPGYKSSMYYVHKVVAELFLQKEVDKPYLSFKNLDRSDCRVANLEYLTKEQNYEYRMKTFVSPYEVHPNLVTNKGSLSDSEVRLIRRLKNNSPTKLAHKFGCSYRTIWAIQSNRTYNRVK